MKQIKVSLQDEMRAQVEAAASAAGHSIGEEIRQRIERTLHLDSVSPETRDLLKAIEVLAQLVLIQTGHNWFQHPAATRVLQQAIVARMARRKSDEAIFAPGELPPRRLVAAGSDDPSAMAVALEAIVEFDERREREHAQRLQELSAEARKREAGIQKIQEEAALRWSIMTDAEKLEHQKANEREAGGLMAALEALKVKRG